MDLGERLNAFVGLGKFLDWFCKDNIPGKSDYQGNKTSDQYSRWSELLNNRIISAENFNPWFTRGNILYALESISFMLESNKLDKWINHYDLSHSIHRPLTVGAVLAGNIPMVGFSDFLCVLISGHVFLAKLSSKDKQLFPLISDILVEIEPGFKNRIIFAEEKLKDFDIVIATGSNNTSRYFEYYFGKYPNIIRKNRSSVAVLDGNEKDEELVLLGNDILIFFGLGCRNVSKIYLPEKYSPVRILEKLENFSHLGYHNKFANNYDYNKSIYLMNNISFLDNGFLLFKEDDGMFPPVSVVYYEYYKNFDEVKDKIKNQSEGIQCIVSRKGLIEESVEFGESQQPGLSDYADNIDTMEFIRLVADERLKG